MEGNPPRRERRRGLHLARPEGRRRMGGQAWRNGFLQQRPPSRCARPREVINLAYFAAAPPAQADFGNYTGTAAVLLRACPALCSVMRTSTKGAQTSQPSAKPWDAEEKNQSPERARQGVPPFQGFVLVEPFSQGVALGWLVAGPLALHATAGAKKCRTGSKSIQSLRRFSTVSPSPRCRTGSQSIQSLS